MHHVPRHQLSVQDDATLRKKQAEADNDLCTGKLDVDKKWRAARKTKHLKRVLAVLQAMAGPTARCMYCLDSHGTDIEHWRPKRAYPESMFVWPNLLLCCTECGRFKGDTFPLTASGIALMIDPTIDDPWDHLDFDPLTGQITASFDVATNAFDARGEATATVLHFPQREAMHEAYRRTWMRLCDIANAHLRRKRLDHDELLAALRAADSHGLLGWCLSTRGTTESPFRELLATHPSVIDRYRAVPPTQA